MHLGSIFFLIGVVCLVLNTWYMFNSSDFSNLGTENRQLVGLFAVLLAPFATLLYLLMLMNSLVIKGRK